MLMNLFRNIQKIMDISEVINKQPIKVEVVDKVEEAITNKNNTVEKVEVEEVAEHEENIIDNKSYVYSFKKCVLSEYNANDGSIGCGGDKLKEDYSVASHNMPLGTKIYIPSLKDKINKDGIFEVMDTGGHAFDFDMYLSNENIGKIGKSLNDVYILEWGNGKMTVSYTYIIKYYISKGILSKYNKAWEMYKKDGKLIKFFKFNNEDEGIENRDYY